RRPAGPGAGMTSRSSGDAVHQRRRRAAGRGQTMKDTLMWEVRAAEGHREELAAWVEEHALSSVAATAGFQGAEVYLGGQDRVVVIAHWSGEAGRFPDPPEEFLARPVAQWPFQFHRKFG